MTKEEMMRSFLNVRGRCKQNCPYQGQCNGGVLCIFREAALIMRADNERITELKEQRETMRALAELILGYANFMEGRCYEYYDMIHAYNCGHVNKMDLPRYRVLATRKRKRTRKMNAEKEKFYRQHPELKDGDPRFAMPSTTNTTSEPLEFV